MALGAFAGLGLAAKIAIGAVAATAVGVAGAGAAGAVGGLPAPAQEVFNQVTGHPGGEHVSETGIENSEFGQKTAEDARQKGEEQRQAALENAEEKRQAGLDTAEEASQTGAEHSDGAGEAGLENPQRTPARTDSRPPERRRTPISPSRAAAMGLNRRRNATETSPPDRPRSDVPPRPLRTEGVIVPPRELPGKGPPATAVHRLADGGGSSPTPVARCAAAPSGPGVARVDQRAQLVARRQRRLDDHLPGRGRLAPGGRGVTQRGAREQVGPRPRGKA